MTLPTITRADPPQQAVNKLSKALGVQLPSNFGQITLVKSDKLATVQRGVKAFDRLTLVLPLVTIVLLALTLGCRQSPPNRAAAGGGRLFADDRGKARGHPLAGHAGSSAHNPQVAQSLLGQLLNGFFVLTAWVLGVALAVLVITVLMGPYRWAVATRSSVKRTWRSIAQAAPVTTAARSAGWPLMRPVSSWAGAVVAGILLLVVSVSWLSFLIIGVLLAAYEIYLQGSACPAL